MSDLLPVVSFVYEVAIPHTGDRYVTGLVVEHLDGSWRHRPLPRVHWLFVPPDEGPNPEQLSRLAPYRDPRFPYSEPLSDDHGWLSGPSIREERNV